MPSIFLSPSTQEYNEYVIGGNEEYYTNLIADALEPYLTAAGISFGRNDPNLTVGGSVRLSNSAPYDLHLAIHTNASPESLAGQIQGIDVYYYPGSVAGERFAELTAENLENVYPYPELVGSTPTTSLYEVRETDAPAILAEIGYHDNVEDAQWIVSNIDNIAQALANSVSQYFGLSSAPPTQGNATVSTEGFSVKLRNEPNWAAAAVTVVPNGASVIVSAENNGWANVSYNGYNGYINSIYLA